MYGEDILNNHYTLRYSLTKEFFETFSSLKYFNIELPLVIIRYFHAYIQEHVNENINNEQYVTSMKKKHSLITMKDAQHTLSRNPRLEQNLSADPIRKMILMPGIMAPFALKQLARHEVMFMVTNDNDLRTLENVELPKQMQIFQYRQNFINEKVSAIAFKDIESTAIKILNNIKIHPLFKSQEFTTWLFKHLRIAIRIINVLKTLINNYPIKVIVDHVEIVNPGTTLSLLAKQYNLPFFNIPRVLISDRSLIPTRASHHCAWGENYKIWLQKRGIPASKIYETGNINFEYKKYFSPMPKLDFLKSLSIPSHHKIITFTTQPFIESTNLTIIDWIKEAIGPNDPLTLIIRPHPHDKYDYNSLFVNQKNIIVSQIEYNLYDILHNTDIVMTVSSSTSIEAALLGKGIIVLQPPIPYHYEIQNNNFHSHLVRAGAGPVIYDQNGLSATLSKLSKDPEFINIVLSQTQKFLKNTINSPGRPSVLTRRTIVSALMEVSK
ncbi:hypothetical protein [Metabacillus rhizolycopersici]|uniref:UDP-N-acetylglucosamine 2-epimerase domain-containing protein n=1 Tax=Metabacillus rhizolycopersici TaxID=2875709 RepID=A0ABS7UUR9_9BACI|nr:hypothetical protein [Metabacillus rhizolycopersici]MBZ5751969.1 hypothetical protein [Metabacillus rhizolycopersici]